MEIEKNLPIGFMDSGLGGLSVLKEALRVMPYEDFIYYGDSAHAPYGTKEPEQIRELTFHVVEHLLDRGTKGLLLPVIRLPVRQCVICGRCIRIFLW